MSQIIYVILANWDFTHDEIFRQVFELSVKTISMLGSDHTGREVSS